MPKFNEFELRYEYDKNGKQKVVPIEDYVERALDGSDYGRGQLETVEERARNTSEMMARLISVLYKSKTLSRKQIEAIVGRA